MSHYEPYPEYIKTGMKWLPKIPEHWEIVQSRRLFSQRKERANEGDRQLTASQKYGIVYQAEFMELEGARVMQVIKGADILKRVCPNDFVISMRSFQGGLEWSSLEGSISSAYVMLVPRKHVVADFFRYLFKSAPYIQALQSTSDLIRDGQALRFDNFAQVDLPIIPEDEQVKIAKYLDRETVRIDALIEKKTRFIELLREKRQALITHAVTKGLDPSVNMKNSGVEWLGEVPEHWVCKKLMHWMDGYGSGTTPSKEDDYCVEGGLPWVTTGELREGLISETDKRVTDVALSEYSALKAHPVGSLVIAMYGATVGRLGLLGVPAALNQACFAIHPCNTISIRLLRWWFEGFRTELIELATGAGQPNISGDKIRNLFIAAPLSLEEQEQIADQIESRTLRIDGLVSKTERSIELLKERRSALITAAVTGQIDLREAV